MKVASDFIKYLGMNMMFNNCTLYECLERCVESKVSENRSKLKKLSTYIQLQHVTIYFMSSKLMSEYVVIYLKCWCVSKSRMQDPVIQHSRYTESQAGKKTVPDFHTS